MRALPLLLAAVAAAAQDSPLARLQKDIDRATRRGVEAFVFIGGGSGALISEDGYFLTNHHVAGFVKEGTNVFLHDGRRFYAKIVCTDSLGDLSLFRIENKDGVKFEHLPLADSDALAVGDYAIAVGNPFNLGTLTMTGRHYPSVSVGIVSALHRRQGTYTDCIQTDAALNPGNSGGPLISLDGELIGINGRIATRFANRVNSGVGFAIPSNQIRRFLKVMMKGGDEGQAYHGEIKGLDLASEHSNGQGARVNRVAPGTQAETAGFRPRDLIVRVDEAPVFSRDRFLGAIGTYPAGEQVKCTVRRGDEELAIWAKLERIQDPAAAQQAQRPPGSGYLGVRMEDAAEGILLSDVVSESPADIAGLKIGDVIVKIGDTQVSKSADFLKILWKAKPGEKVKLTIRRDGKELEFEVELTKYPGE
jgi:S1-C subfamily serine protease